MELIGAVAIFMKVKRLISFTYWNGVLLVCVDVWNVSGMDGRVHVWVCGQFGVLPIYTGQYYW
jgi:hypothetical protein